MNHILLLEDDGGLIDGLTYALPKNGFSVDVARSLAEVDALLKAQSYDLLLLDVSLPDGSGFSLCERVRLAGNPVPIIFLTASDEETSIIRGLDSGADDYITKPFRLGELCSRIRARLRRSPADGLLRAGPLTIDRAAGRALLHGVPLALTAAEYRLLCCLAEHSGQTLTRAAILDALWDGQGCFVDDNTLSVYIRRLREKVELDPSHPIHLLTVRGLGYQWKGDAT